MKNNKDHLYIELTEVKSYMKGISPKTSTYQNLEKRKNEIEKLLEQDTSPVLSIKSKVSA